MRRWVLLFVVVVLAVSARSAWSEDGAAERPLADDLRRRLFKFYGERGQELAYKYELQESEEPPAWACDEDAPIFRFVQITDVHLTPARRKLLLAALGFISAEVRPAFVAITGDNASPGRLRDFKQVLDAHLSAPRFVLRGDNWPEGFTDVFGAADWSFRLGGITFVGASLDRDIRDAGIGVFEPDTVLWIAGRLDAARRDPVVFFMHEPLVPATFLDAPRLLALFESRGNVVATVTGHLHHDYETRGRGTVHMVAPAFGPHRDHPFKVFNVHPDHITVRTVKFRDGGFRYVTLFQRIDFREGTRLAPPADPGERSAWLSPSAMHAPPPREIVFDPALARRAGELVPHAAAFLITSGRAGEVIGDVAEMLAESERITTRPTGTVEGH